MTAPATFLERVRAADERYYVEKRLLDIILGGAFFLCSLPVMLIVAVLIVIDSPGPILFRQKRVGENGAEFFMFKFRSMTHNADSGVHVAAVTKFMQGVVLNSDEKADSPYKLGNDTRITRIGKFIRKTSLDELPQFWNIVSGEMSLVGPRPPLPYEVALYDQKAMLRLQGKPGLTGPWQVYGRGKVKFQTMIEMDITYLHTHSIWNDLKLVVLTVPAAIKGKGGA